MLEVLKKKKHRSNKKVVKVYDEILKVNNISRRV